MRCPDTPHSIISKLNSQNNQVWNISWTKFYEMYSITLKQMTINAFITEIKRAPTDDEITDVISATVMSIRNAFESGVYQPKKYKFRGFLKTIIKRRVVDYLRHSSRKRQIQYSDCDIDLCDISTYDNRLDEDEEREYKQALIMDILGTTRTNFDAKTWLCFEMRHLRNMKISTICDELNTDAKKVYKNIHKVLCDIRKNYSSEYYQKELNNE
ncbi:MAG: sigma-70 family RNA polymerase sigma factor [Verrucomicrobiaceae bacterium]|nr:sigma-70 family RNA polymerase sigma factor [Verrucomicrobiaceae bacterium]